MKNKNSDLWETPQDLFDKLNEGYNFQIDLCANEHNHKCNIWCDDLENLNTDELIPDRWCFMNPPYSSPYKFVKLALELPLNVVMLLRCDTSTKTFGLFYDYKTQQAKPGIKIAFLPKRLKFINPDVCKSTTAPFASVIVEKRHLDDN